MDQEVQGGLPAEPVVPAPATADNVAPPESATAAAPEEQQPAAKTFTQEELNDIVQREKAKAEAKAERRALRAYRESLTQPPAPKPAADATPQRADYASDEAWLDARDAYRDAKREEQRAAERHQAEQARLAKTTNDLYAQAEKIAGFDRDAFDELPLTPVLAGALIESEQAPQLMAYMAAHAEEVERIAALSPARQAVELGKLEAKLSAAPPKTSAAPAPITPIGAAKAATGDLANASMEDYIRLRAKQGAGWAR